MKARVEVGPDIGIDRHWWNLDTFERRQIEDARSVPTVAQGIAEAIEKGIVLPHSPVLTPLPDESELRSQLLAELRGDAT